MDHTPTTTDEYDNECHESWVSLRANRVTSSRGAKLFGSEILHTHFVVVKLHRVSRKRELSTDWHYERELLMECSMSMAQWGAFVSSFGDGSALPTTLNYLTGDEIAQELEPSSRIGEHIKEVKGSTAALIAELNAKVAALTEAFNGKAGSGRIRELLRAVQIELQNAPANAEFVTEQMSDFVESVVTKARGDIEAMVAQHAATLGITTATFPTLELEAPVARIVAGHVLLLACGCEVRIVVDPPLSGAYNCLDHGRQDITAVVDSPPAGDGYTEDDPCDCDALGIDCVHR